jgi:hypothetical protein
MWNDTIEEEELAHISSYLTLSEAKNSRIENPFISYEAQNLLSRFHCWVIYSWPRLVMDRTWVQWDIRYFGSKVIKFECSNFFRIAKNLCSNSNQFMLDHSCYMCNMVLYLLEQCARACTVPRTLPRVKVASLWFGSNSDNVSAVF